MTEYIHYGTDQYDPARIPNKIECLANGKPIGLWACKADEDDWRSWCESEGFHPENLEKNFRFELKQDAKILTVHREEEIIPYLELNPTIPYFVRRMMGAESGIYDKLDPKKLASYDGIEYIAEGPGKGYLEIWDVDSLVLWNDVVA